MSVRLVIEIESTADVFFTETENVAVPPGSWIEDGLADFVTAIELGRSVIATVASSLTGDGVAVVIGAGRGDRVLVRLPALPLRPRPLKEQL